MQLEERINKDEKVLFKAEKNTDILYLVATFGMLSLISLFFIINLIIIFINNYISFQTGDNILLTAVSLVLAWGPMFIFLNIYLNGELYITDNNLYIKKAFPENFIVVPLENIKALQKRSFKIFNLEGTYLMVYLINGKKIKSSYNFRDIFMNRVKEALINKDIQVVNSTSNFVFETYNASSNKKMIEVHSLKPILNLFILVSFIISIVLFYLLASDLNRRIGEQKDISIIGQVYDKYIIYFKYSSNYYVGIQNGTTGVAYQLHVSKDFYEKAFKGEKVKISCKKGSIGILYDILYNAY